MLSLSSPIRVAVTILLVVAIPFCCCNFRSLLGGCRACGSAQPSQELPVAKVTQHHCHSSHENGDELQSDSESPAPSTPEEKHDCKCGKDDGKMLTVEKTTVEFPAPVMVAVLNWSLVSDLLPDGHLRVSLHDFSASARPPTSLLRIHCALIV
jgi:hypothetical protein